MTRPMIQGTMATGSNPTSGNASAVCIVPTGVTTMRLTTSGLNGSNTIRTQKRSAGGAWVNQTTYNSDQNNVGITVAAGEEWRVQGITQQATKDIRYKLSCES